MAHAMDTLPTSLEILTHPVPQICMRGVLNSKDIEVTHVETIYLEMYELEENWADHAIAFSCCDMIRNQWSKVFYF